MYHYVRLQVIFFYFFTINLLEQDLSKLCLTFNYLLACTCRFADGGWVNSPYAHDLPSYVFSW